MNDPLYFEDALGNLSGVPKCILQIQWIIQNVVSKRKKDEFEGVGVTNFGFMEKMSDVPRS